MELLCFRVSSILKDSRPVLIYKALVFNVRYPQVQFIWRISVTLNFIQETENVKNEIIRHHSNTVYLERFFSGYCDDFLQVFNIFLNEHTTTFDATEM